MADILQGNTSHSAVAPLSQAQTVQMCQHLQAEIRSLEGQLSGVARDLQHTQEHMQGLREKATQSYDDMHNLQVGLANANTNVDKVSKELGRVGVATQELQRGDQQIKDKITLLEESFKMHDVRLDVVLKDVKMCKENDKIFKDALDRNVYEDLRVLRKELASTNLVINTVCAEQKQTALFEKENRDAIRDARVDTETVSTEVKKTNTVANILENRLASTSKGLQQAWTKCSELSDVMVKLNECYDKTKARVTEAEGYMKEVDLTSRKTHEELEQAVRQIEYNSDRLTQALKRLDEEGTSTEEMRHLINGLRQGQANATKHITKMQRDIAEVNQLAASVKAGLKEQSSLLLPNIHMDSPEAVSASQRHGSLLISSTTNSPVRPSSRGTPRGKIAG